MIKRMTSIAVILLLFTTGCSDWRYNALQTTGMSDEIVIINQGDSSESEEEKTEQVESNENTFGDSGKEEYPEATEAALYVLTKETLFYNNGRIATETEYDITGKTIKSIYNAPAGSFSSRFEYEYDKDLLVRKTSYLSDERLNGRWIYEYNDCGNLVKETCYASNGAIDHSADYEYDDRDRLTTATIYFSDGKVDTRQKFEYDAEDHLVKEIFSGKDFSSWNEYEYDDQGKLVKKTSFDSNGTANSRTDYEYDDAGNIVKETFGSNIYKYKNEYDQHGNLIKVTMYVNDMVYRWTEYEYTKISR